MDEYFVQQRDYLLEISRALTSQLSLNDVLRVTLRSATKMLGGQAGLVALIQGDEFHIRASYGIEPRMLEKFTPLLREIPLTDPERFDGPSVGQKMRLVAQTARIGVYEVIALPMKIGSELIGVVFIFRPQGYAFSRNDIRLLQSFADQAAIAVQNARLYEQVATEKMRLNALLLHSADGILILKADGSVESVNIALAEMLGIDENCDIEAVTHDELIRWAYREPGPDLSEAVANGWPTSPQSTLYVEGELRHMCKDERVPVGMTYAPLFDHMGGLRNIIVNVRDITKFKEAERAKSTFISVISHELKTPVSIIKGYAETLRRDDVQWDRSVVTNGLNIILEESEKLTDLIESLLDVSRAQAGMLKMRYSSVRMGKLADRLAERLQTQTDAHKIVVDVDPTFPVIHADEKRLVGVLNNLISNAIKYSPHGGVITIGGRPVSEHEVEITVSDQGVGISPEQQERIFEPFYRVDNGSTRETEGVGLGLHIVQQIIEAHGGSISVESALGQGTAFVIRLPVVPE